MSQSAGKASVWSSLADAHLALGDVFRDEGNCDEAVAEYQKAVAGNKTSALAHGKLGSALIDVGQFKDAVANLEQAIELQATFGSAYRDLASLARQGEYTFDEAQIRDIESLIEQGQMPPDQAGELQYTLGDILDTRGDHAAAFEAYERANTSRYQLLSAAGAAFNAEYFEQTVDATIATFDKAFFEQTRPWGNATEQPVFVVGMPRSGTTLTEQILGSHPNIIGVGERRDIALLAGELPDATGGGEYPGCVRNITETLISQFAQRYLDNIDHTNSETLRFVDKTPTNFLLLGLIIALFPKAKVVHCQRDPRDVALSCYFQSFANVDWSHRLEDIGTFYRGYQRVMRHWQDHLPVPIHNLEYERLVSDNDATCRELLAFCDVPWSDDCLNFHRQKGAVKTASRVQVRQPLNTRSVQRWKPYEPQLALLTRFLDNQS